MAWPLSDVPPGGAVFYLQKEPSGADGLGLELALQWTEATDELVKSYVNSVPTPNGGSHENGLKSAVVKAVRNYLAINNLVPRGLSVAAEDVREGMVAILSCFLPHPQFQEVAATGVDEIVSTKLPAGADPIKEAQRRCNILLVIRMGGIDQEAPNTPPIDAPPPGGMRPPHPPMLPQPGMMPPPGMMPHGGGLPLIAPGMNLPGHAGPGLGGPPMVPYTHGPSGPNS